MQRNTLKVHCEQSTLIFLFIKFASKELFQIGLIWTSSKNIPRLVQFSMFYLFVLKYPTYLPPFTKHWPKVLHLLLIISQDSDFQEKYILIVMKQNVSTFKFLKFIYRIKTLPNQNKVVTYKSTILGLGVSSSLSTRLLAQVVFVPVGRLSGGQLAMRLVGNISNIPPPLPPPLCTFRIERDCLNQKGFYLFIKSWWERP